MNLLISDEFSPSLSNILTKLIISSFDVLYISSSLITSSFFIICFCSFSSEDLFFFENKFLLLFNLFFTFFIFCVKLSVKSVSCIFFFKVDIVAIKHVLGLIPSDSFNKKVNLVSLYGIKFSPKLWITFPNPNKALFILPVSFSFSPIFSTDFCFSIPAKSTKFNIVLIFISSSFSNFDKLILIEKIAWLLDLVFIICANDCLFKLPNLINSKTSFLSFNFIFFKFSFKTPSNGFSLNIEGL